MFTDTCIHSWIQTWNAGDLYDRDDEDAFAFERRVLKDLHVGEDPSTLLFVHRHDSRSIRPSGKRTMEDHHQVYRGQRWSRISSLKGETEAPKPQVSFLNRVQLFIHTLLSVCDPMVILGSIPRLSDRRVQRRVGRSPTSF